jgi:hypothetical protein
VHSIYVRLGPKTAPANKEPDGTMAAERAFIGDPSTTLIKLRQFGE